MKILYHPTTIPFTQNTVLTIGSFDGIHLGHVQLLQEITQTKTKHPDWKTVLVTFEPLPKIFFEQKPHSLLTTLEEKLHLLQNFEIDYCYVINFNQKIANISAEEFYAHIIIPHLHPSCVVIGQNHTFGKDRSGDITKLQGIAHSYKFQFIPKKLLKSESLIISSGQIKNLLEKGDIIKANQMLGYNYNLNGKVIKGKQLGRKIGFPTANLAINPQKFLPKFGVYKVKVALNHQNFEGLLNIGTNPTTEDHNTETKIEVFIKNFDQDIYGQHLKVYLESFIREEKKFENIDALKKQIQLDLKLN